jgi:hypothetical protein
MGWESRVNDFYDRLLRLPIGVSDEIEDVLVFDVEASEGVLLYKGSGLSSGMDGDREKLIRGKVWPNRRGHGRHHSTTLPIGGLNGRVRNRSSGTLELGTPTRLAHKIS